MSSNITPAQEEFIKVLNVKLQKRFSSQLDGVFQTMNVPNGFNWGVQFGPNDYYNRKSLNEVDLQALIASNGIMTLGNSNFTTLYNSILQNVAYVFSAEDEHKMKQEEASASAQIQTVINSWETDVGQISDDQITQSKCFPATKLSYIDYWVQYRCEGDINKIPFTMQSFRMAYQTYQVAAQTVFRLQSASAQAMLKVKRARENSLTPSAANKGLQTAASSYYAAFGPFPTQNKINGGLQTPTNQASVRLSLRNFSSKETDLSIEGNAGISIPVKDLFSIDFGGSTSYTLDRYASSSTTLDMSIKYEGITFVGAPLTDGNLSTDGKTGWYDNDILEQAISNTDRGKTGYALLGSQFPVDKYFGVGKIFSRVKTWVISQEPTISMKFYGADINLIGSDFKEKASATIKLFGIFGIGSVTQNYEVKKVDSTSMAGCVIVEMGPSKTVGTTPSQDAVAVVVGGVPSYPPNNT